MGGNAKWSTSLRNSYALSCIIRQLTYDIAILLLDTYPR